MVQWKTGIQTQAVETVLCTAAAVSAADMDLARVGEMEEEVANTLSHPDTLLAEESEDVEKGVG